MTDTAGFAWTADDALVRADAVLATLQRAGMRIPAANRIALAKKTILATRDPHVRIGVGDPYVQYVVEAHRSVLEAHAICAAMDPRRPAPAEKLCALLEGGEIPEDDRNPWARNTQFELLVAAIMRLAGFASVSMSEPDIRIDSTAGSFGIAAKRLRSAKHWKWQQHVTKATRQLRHQKLQGFLAFNLDGALTGDTTDARGTADGDLDAANIRLASAVERLVGMIPPGAAGTDVLGLLGFGTRFDWLPGIDGVSTIGVRFLFNVHWTAPADLARPVERFSRELGRRITRGIESLLPHRGPRGST